MTFGVQPGSVTGFLGPNGAGKTTTMRAVFGLTALDAGTVRYDGHPIDQDDRRRFGYLPEERGLYPTMRVAEQLRFLGQLRGMSRADVDREAARWLGELGLADRIGDELEDLSLGNQQRVQLIGALLHRPDVLVLDEPFSGLDPVAVDALSKVLVGEARRGATVLFSSHQLDLVEDLCERAVVVDRGRVVTAGHDRRPDRRRRPGARDRRPVRPRRLVDAGPRRGARRGRQHQRRPRAHVVARRAGDGRRPGRRWPSTRPAGPAPSTTSRSTAAASPRSSCRWSAGPPTSAPTERRR